MTPSGEIVLGGIVGEVGEGQHDDGEVARLRPAALEATVAGRFVIDDPQPRAADQD